MNEMSYSISFLSLLKEKSHKSLAIASPSKKFAKAHEARAQIHTSFLYHKRLKRADEQQPEMNDPIL